MVNVFVEGPVGVPLAQASSSSISRPVEASEAAVPPVNFRNSRRLIPGIGRIFMRELLWCFLLAGEWSLPRWGWNCEARVLRARPHDGLCQTETWDRPSRH